MKQNETKNGQTVANNLSSSLPSEKKGFEGKKTFVFKLESLTAEEKAELVKKKIEKERREELLNKLSEEDRKTFLEKERLEKFYAKHKACYLQLYCGYLDKKNNKKSRIKFDTRQLLDDNWGSMLKSFERKNQIENVEIVNISPSKTEIRYDFMVDNMIYEADCESMETILSQNSLMFEPMGDIVKERKLEDIDNIDTSDRKDDFNWEHEKEADEKSEEIISKEDSTTNKLNKNIAKELRKDNSVVVDIASKATGKSKAEVAEALRAG